jgi:hypothetical protein
MMMVGDREHFKIVDRVKFPVAADKKVVVGNCLMIGKNNCF